MTTSKPKARQVIDVLAHSTEQYGGLGWPPEKASEFLEWFRKRLETIPKHYRASAKITVCGIQSFDDCDARIEITYRRPETYKEATARRRVKTAERAAMEVEEIEELERLKAKYPNELSLREELEKRFK